MLNVTRSNSDLRQNEKDQDMLDMIQKIRRDICLPTYLYDWLLQEASKEYLYMHDLLQEMGRDIVSQKSPTDAGGCSRLWSLKDINDVLKENKGTGNIESFVLHIQQSFKVLDWHPDCLSNMKELRLLDLSKVHLSRNLNYLPGALKIMRWEYYALESLPPVDQLHELESLQLCNIAKSENYGREHRLKSLVIRFLAPQPEFNRPSICYLYQLHMALATPDIGAPGSSAPSTSLIINYDVFLSFCGADFGNSFAHHLYSALRRKGIETFIDERIEKGEEIAVQTVQAIKESQFAFVVLSENYLSSPWCLKELREIMESRHERGRLVVPVFYHINPSEVRHQRGRIDDIFARHEKGSSSSNDEVRRWRDAVREIADLAGWQLTDHSS
ncbi:hypothetical protein K1719_029944 [Acacia pycnantha]|nr:hypothetical protein K1719_029944 [Acacia pycnantha]